MDRVGTRQYTPAVEAATKCVYAYGMRHCTLGYSECDEFTLWCELENIECGYQHGNACDIFEAEE